MSSSFSSSLESSSNPLMGYMRHPKIYISLPSNGLYWQTGSIDITENGLYPVFSMTARDELIFKTPDALLNGQAIVEVIQSCMPNIKNAWLTPATDIDTILIAIRISSYGEMMDITHNVPNTDESVTHQIDLRILLDEVNKGPAWQEAVECNDEITCFIKPLTYKHMSKVSLKTFEVQRMIQSVNDSELEEDQKIKLFNKSVESMTDLTIDVIVESIESIQTPHAIVTDKVFIKEFIENSDSSISKKIQSHVLTMREKQGIQPVMVRAEPEHIDKGAPETYYIPITMDNSDFFGQGS